MNKNYRGLTEKSSRTRAEKVETANKAEATVRLYVVYEMLKLAKGTHDADVINFITNNQQTSIALAPLSEGEKSLIQELYCMINAKSGNIKFDVFWLCPRILARNCFDEDGSSDQIKVTHHAMVTFEKPAAASKHPSTIYKRTQLTGNLKAGPEKRKREDDNSEPSADDNLYVTNKRFHDLCSLVGQIVKNTKSQKENQRQGRQGDRESIRDRGYNKEREPYRRQGGWDCKAQSSDHNDESRQYANTATASGLKSRKSEHQFNKHGSSNDSDGEDTHHYAHVAFTNDVFRGVNRERKMYIS